MPDQADDQNAHAIPVLRKDRMKVLAEEQEVGGHFEGESLREGRVGIQEEVVVDLFKRVKGSLVGTYFARVSLRSQVRFAKVYRSDVDMDRYTNESDFLNVVGVAGGALAEADNETGASWDTEYVAKRARAAASELLHEVSEQG